MEAVMMGLLIVGGLGTTGVLVYLSATGRLEKLPISQMFGLLGMSAGFIIGPCSFAIHADQQTQKPVAKEATKDVPESFFDTDRFYLLGKEGPYRIGGEEQTGARSVDVLWDLEAGATIKLPYVTSLNGNYWFESVSATVNGETRELHSSPPDEESGEVMVNPSEEKLQPEYELVPKDFPQFTSERLHEVVPVELQFVLRYPSSSDPTDVTFSYSREEYQFPVRFHLVTSEELAAMEVIRSAKRKMFPVMGIAGFLLIAVSLVLTLGFVTFGGSVGSYRQQSHRSW